jgi:hypothetical protein
MKDLFLCFEELTFCDYKIKTRPIDIGRVLINKFISYL